ncbi:4Fe-4S dicluster domain-containing protein [Luminiphilus sp. nBUS_07]|uniref:4Fe-4S dicluster domain-containing protein n=1 Tax=Luminiphilus sp. nBUS_07 TaxID=3395314 RepID=UPI003EB7C7A1
MASKKSHHFTPDENFTKLLHDHSGNTINGVGEPQKRRPTMVWWAPNPETAPFGEAQKWFYSKEQPDEEMLELRRSRHKVVAQSVPDIATQKVMKPPQNWTDQLQQFIDSGDCEMTGVTPLEADWVFDHEDTTLPNIVMIGVQHDYEELKHVPDIRGGKDVTRQYLRAAAAAKKVAAWVREQGYQADAVTGPMTGKILMIPPAIACGFGELGKHGSIINKEFGSAFRLSAVLTDAPFASTPPREFGVDDFCSRCRVCENACPPEAITPEKQTVRGVDKWYVDFERCIPYFAETSGCAICIAVCPWSLPTVGLSLTAKLQRRAERLAIEASKQ